MIAVEEIISWIKEAGERIKASLETDIHVDEKSNRTDLVTNIDKETQQFLIEKIRENDPNANILAEEEGFSEQAVDKGRVYIIDPIDGTLNFVLEQENFCVMLAIFEEGIGQYGFIYDVMRNELYWGSKNGVYCNNEKIAAPENIPLEAGLIGMNAYMYAHDRFSALEIGEQSMGIRISGCAGLEMIAMLKGNHHAYISNLSPWDYAAGIVLLEAFGFQYSTPAGQPLKFSGREPIFIGNKQTYQQMLAINEGKS